MKEVVSIRALVAAAACLACGWAQAVGVNVNFSQDMAAVAGQGFTLIWNDDDIPPATGFTDTDILVDYDANVLTLDSGVGGSAFGIANTTHLDGYPPAYPGTTTQSWYTVVQSSPAAAYGSDVFSVHFTVAGNASAGDTHVFFTAIAGLTGVPGYYDFNTAYDVPVSVSVVPEPAALMMLLAGLGLLGAGAARQRRGPQA